jgi:hypothetical protein
MFAKRVLLTVFPLPLLAIAGLGLIAFTSHTSKRDDTLSVNSGNYDRARQHLEEADQCLADAVAGLRRVAAAKEQVVLGDRHLASTYIREITELRERLRRLSKEADAKFGGMMLPELNPSNED